MDDARLAALETPIVVLPRKKFAGVEKPNKPGINCAERKCTTHTHDWRARPGSPQNTHRVTAAEALSLGEALTRRFSGDAMLTSYAVFTADGALVARPPRVNKGGLEWMEREGYRLFFTCLFADIDNPPLPNQKEHGPWTPELRDRQRDLWETVPALRTAGYYLGGGGWRIVQPLAEPVPIALAEDYLADWHAELLSAGIAIDERCRDWPRLYRAPHALRDGALYCIEPPEFARMVPIARSAPARRSAVARARTTKSRPGFDLPGGFASDLPSDWPPARIARVADAVRAVESAWHDLFLALAGSLVDRGASPAHVPALCGAISAATGVDTRTGDRVEGAQSTVACAAGGVPYTGDATLRARWPGVAAALDEVGGSMATARLLRAYRAPTLPAVDLDHARALIAHELAAPYGNTMVEAPPGTGKTRAGVERARRLPVINSDRTPPGSRWSWSVPDHDLGLEVVATARALGVPVARVLSPLAHRQPDGTPTCVYHDAAAPLVAGGQSVEREFCEGRGKQPCEHAKTCPARAGYEGDPMANLVVGPHALLGTLDAYAGSSGVLVIDEPGEVVKGDLLTLDALATAARYLDAFVGAYRAAIAPALAALRAWVAERAPEGEVVRIEDAIRAASGAVPFELVAAAIDPESTEDLGGSIVAAARGAIDPEGRSMSPPILWVQMAVARKSPGRAAELGAASKVLDLLWRCLVAPDAPMIRVEGQGDDRRAVITRIDEGFARAQRRQGPVVTLDANASMRAPATAKVLGYEPRLVRIRVADKAVVRRTAIACSNATQRAWLPVGVPDWRGGILGAIRAMVAWACEDASTRTLAVFTWSTIEAVIAHARDPRAVDPITRWKARGMPMRALEAARALLAPVLDTFPGEILTGHYFDLRGKNIYQECDASFTLGDPRPNLGAARDACTFLGLDEDGFVDARAAAELEQAHGRLRTINREAPGRMGHFGAVLPGGWAGARVDFREATGGRPRTIAAMSAREFADVRARLGMGVREFGRAIGKSPQSVLRWERGEGDGSAVPPDVAVAVLALAVSVPETSIQNSS